MKTTILIVEDEPILYERLRRFLTKENLSNHLGYYRWNRT